jgi:hypothetical protein
MRQDTKDTEGVVTDQDIGVAAVVVALATAIMVAGIAVAVLIVAGLTGKASRRLRRGG